MSEPRIFQLVHTTAYAYDADVTTSYGQMHLTLTDAAGQQVLRRQLLISPTPDEQREHTDFYGNISTFFLVSTPHRRLAVTARTTVSVSREAPDTTAVADASVAELAAQSAADPAVAEFLLPSPRVTLSTALIEYATDVLSSSVGLHDALTAVMQRVQHDFRYRTGATTVLTDLDQLLTKRAGVCQDFAHLAVGMLRSVGLPARYVSGYLETQPVAGKPKLQGADASHAWASVYAAGLGWIDFDPTNNTYVDGRYLQAAVGRDYGDVPPLKGVIVTTATQSTMRVSVDVSRVG